MLLNKQLWLIQKFFLGRRYLIETLSFLLIFHCFPYKFGIPISTLITQNFNFSFEIKHFWWVIDPGCLWFLIYLNFKHFYFILLSFLKFEFNQGSFIFKIGYNYTIPFSQKFSDFYHVSRFKCLHFSLMRVQKLISFLRFFDDFQFF